MGNVSKRKGNSSRVVERHDFLIKLNLDTRVRGGSREIGTAMMRFYDIESGHVRVSYAKLAKVASRHPATAIRAVKKLESLGYFALVERGGRWGGRKYANVYRPRLEVLSEDPEQSLHIGATASRLSDVARARARTSEADYEQLRDQLAAERERRAAKVL